MKHLAVRLLLFLLTFSIGVAFQAILKSKKHVEKREVVLSTEPIVKVVEVPVTLAAASSSPHLILDYDPTKFEPYGYFGIIGKKPSQFSEIDTLGVEVYEEEGAPAGSITISTVDGENYDSQPAAFGILTTERLFFVTAPFKSGFEYRFEGLFLHKKFPENWAGTNHAVIEGTITKSKLGKKIAEAHVKLRLESFGC